MSAMGEGEGSSPKINVFLLKKRTTLRKYNQINPKSKCTLPHFFGLRTSYQTVISNFNRALVRRMNSATSQTPNHSQTNIQKMSGPKIDTVIYNITINQCQLFQPQHTNKSHSRSIGVNQPSAVRPPTRRLTTTVQKEGAYIHYGPEFWTQLITIGNHTQNLDVLDTYYRRKQKPSQHQTNTMNGSEKNEFILTRNS